MADTRFMKTVTYGGYNKEDVIKQFASLNLRINELKNQLTEAKLQLDAYKSGSDIEAAYEAAITQERTQLSELQAQNETYEAMISAYEAEAAEKDAQIKSLMESNATISSGLADANAKITAMQSGDDATTLSTVFIEAQKSANSLKSAAQMEADKIKADAKSLAEDIVIEANNKAAQIVYEAEKKEAMINAEVQNNEEILKVSKNNFRATMLDDMKILNTEIANIRAVLDTFARTGMTYLDKTIDLLKGTENTLMEGGVPEFRQPQSYSPKLPAEPKLQQPVQKNNKPAQQEQPKKKSGALDNLQKMAEGLDGGNKGGGAKKGGIDLAALQKQAESMSSNKKKGGIDLSALQKQAESMNKK